MLIRSALYFSLCLATIAVAQNDFKDYREIEEDHYKSTPSFYVQDLKLFNHPDKNAGIITWKAHPKIRKFLVEMKNSETNELFHRKLYFTDSIAAPISAHITVYPVHNGAKGKPKTTTYARSTAMKQRDLYKQFKKDAGSSKVLSDSQAVNKEKPFPWKWVLRGAGLVALLIGLIARFTKKSADRSGFDDRRSRRKP